VAWYMFAIFENIGGSLDARRRCLMRALSRRCLSSGLFLVFIVSRVASMVVLRLR